jgi:hypothetical protein
MLRRGELQGFAGVRAAGGIGGIPMIVSIRHGFWFVRPRKVAGTSVEMALSAVCGDADIVSPMLPVDERTRQDLGGFSGNYGADRRAEVAYAQAVLALPVDQVPDLKPPSSRFDAHSSIDEIAALTGLAPQDFRLISLTRNPYARVISMLHMRLHFTRYQRGEPMPETIEGLADELDRARAGRGMPALKTAEWFGAHRPELLRHDTLQSDLDGLATSLGIVLPQLPHAKRGIGAEAIDPSSVFNRDQLDWINAWFAEEFVLGGYDPL